MAVVAEWSKTLIYQNQVGNTVAKVLSLPSVLDFSTTGTFSEHKRPASLKILQGGTSYLAP